MSTQTLLAVAVALAMDAFAVALGAGAALKSVSGRQTFRLAWHFGLFQALMPVLGWTGGRAVAFLAGSFGHWIAFGLLAAIGGRMVFGALRGAKRDVARDPTRGLTMVMLSVATSMDALAVGAGLSFLRGSIWWPAFVIGMVAGVFTAVGLHAGRFLASSERIAPAAELLGGIILLAIGLGILRAQGLG